MNLRISKQGTTAVGIEEYKRMSLKEIALNLPETPGCYQYLDSTGRVIYVGKAKNLKRRVCSYFNKEQESAKTRILVSKIRDIKYVVVNTEWDALLLENNLIKKYKPKYNILLKDDKTYPSICISKERFPRVYKTRKIIRNSGEYYGPFSHTATLNRLMDLIHNLYRVRSCRLSLTAEGVTEKKFRPCLEYHIHNCNAPCIGGESEEHYSQQIDEIRQILKGRTTQLEQNLKSKMKKLANDLQFEEAQLCKEKIETIADFREKSQVVAGITNTIDVFSGEQDEEGTVFINYMHVTEGCINQAFTLEFKNKADDTIEDLFLTAITEIRNRYGSNASEIVVPFMPETELEGITWTVPQKGEKKKLLALSELNVKQYKLEKIRKSDKFNPEQKQTRRLKELQKTLNLNKLPIRIELFDNSHTQGTDAVAACVVYEKGKPCRKSYRLYSIKSGVGGDDYASMKEVLSRRYGRMIEEGAPLPDLIIVDGGKGQMSAAKEVFDNLNLKIEIAGLVKNERHKTSRLLKGFPQLEVGIKPDSDLFKQLEQMQEEVHRVAISFHRKKRSKRQTETELTSIKGIGEKTAAELLNKFKSVKRVSETSVEELSTVIGESKAKNVYIHFHDEKGKKGI